MIRMFNSTTIPALQQTLMFTERRHEVLASNIANLDTPDYRAKDLPVGRFQETLAESIERSKRPSPGHSPGLLSNGLQGPGSRRTDLLGRPVERDDIASGPRNAMEPIVYHDGSDVSLERQVTEMSKNSSMHNLAVATMRNQFEMLRAAITERA
jgi:flagellar basal-body rod protein FlgB